MTKENFNTILDNAKNSYIENRAQSLNNNNGHKLRDNIITCPKSKSKASCYIEIMVKPFIYKGFSVQASRFILLIMSSCQNALPNKLPISFMWDFKTNSVFIPWLIL